MRFIAGVRVLHLFDEAGENVIGTDLSNPAVGHRNHVVVATGNWWITTALGPLAFAVTRCDRRVPFRLAAVSKHRRFDQKGCPAIDANPATTQNDENVRSAWITANHPATIDG